MLVLAYPGVPWHAVAVLDTGIDATHPQLKGRVLAGGYNFIDNNDNTADVGNGADDDGDGTVGILDFLILLGNWSSV